MESHPGSGPCKTLRIAIALDAWIVPAWIASVIAGLREEFGIQAVLFPKKPLRKDRQAVLFERYRLWDRGRKLSGPDPFAPVDLRETWQSPPGELKPETTVFSVLLWLSDAPPDAGLVPSTFGTWFFSHGASGCGGSAAYFPELVKQSPVTSSYLLALSSFGDTPLHVAEAHTASELGWSLAKQQVSPFWKAALLPRSALRRIQQGWSGPSEKFESSIVPASNADVLRFAARNLARTARRRMLYGGSEAHWYVAYRINSEKFVAHTGRFTPDCLTLLEAPKGHFYADPFVLTRKGRTFLYVEDYLYAEARGVLAVLELLPDGRFGPAQQILNRPYHLSYPFVFEHEGDVFMIPETLEARRIELYRAVEMPHRWELVKILQEDVDAVDTTLWIDSGTFYFFTNLGRSGIGPNDLLYLFTADSLTGRWHAHPANPISMDVRAARGAGKLFWMGDKLIRPSQDCSVRYGYATQLNHVELLTPGEFREGPLLRIEPNWAPKLIGTHTINSDNIVEVIDGQVYQPKYRR